MDATPLTHWFIGVLYAVAPGSMVVNVQPGYTEVKHLAHTKSQHGRRHICERRRTERTGPKQNPVTDP